VGLRAIVARLPKVGRRRRRRRQPQPDRQVRQDRQDRVTILYEPNHDGDADPGEVVWGWVPYEDDPTQGKDRPIVVIGRWGHDLAGVPLTSKHRPGDPDRIAVGTGAWDPDRRESYACLDRVLRLDAAQVRREGSALDARRFRVVVDALTARRSGR
jgi:hypothetical protein